MFDIKYTHTSSGSSNSKRFSFTGVPGMTIDEKVPPQAQHIIQLAYSMSLDKPIFTLNDLIHYIDECCAYDNTTFTNSKGGTERIVRYYSKLLQTIGVITDINDIVPTEAEDTPESEDE